MQIKGKTRPVTYPEALAALWRVKLRLGQYPIHIRLEDHTPASKKQKGRI